MPVLYELCGWNEEFGYTITGCVKQQSSEKVLLFYMNEPEIRKWVDDKQIITYPEEWKDEFGDYYYTQMAKSISIFSKDKEWRLYVPGVVAVLPDFYMYPDEQIKQEIENIIAEIENEGEDEDGRTAWNEER